MAQQNVEVRIVGKDAASKEILGVGNTLERMKVSVESNRAGMNKLDNALKDVAQNALALPGPLGRLSDAFLEFAPGGIAGAGMIAGIGAIILITKSYFDAAKQSEDITKKLEQSIADVQGRGKEFNLDNLNKELRKLGEESESGWQKFWYGSDGRLFGFGKSWEDQRKELQTEINKTSDTIAKSLQAAQDRNRQAQREIGLAQAERAGRGPQERLKQAQDALVSAESALAVLQKSTTATQTQIVEAQATVSERQAALIRAETALRDDQTRRRSDQIERIRKQEEQASKEKLDREKLLQSIIENGIKYLEQQGRAAEDRRKQIGDMIATDIQATIAQLTSQVDAEIAKMEQAAKKAQEVSQERISALEPFISSAIGGLETMANALASGQNAFKAFGQGAVGAIRSILQALARQNLVEGLSALGKAFAAAANPLTAGSAGGFFASAKQHFLAAAAAGVGSGLLGGGRSAAGGGSVNGGFNNSGLGGINGGASPIYITITGGGVLDMNNPETARSFVQALNTVTNRRAIITTTGR